MGESARAAITGLRPTRAEVDLSALRHNARVVLDHVRQPPSSPLVYGVVKADAYGHGAVAAARAMERAGVDGLGVALVEEGLELRAAGVTAPVLVMSGIHGDALAAALDARLTPVVHHPTQVESLAALGDREAVVHLKVDTGMSRLGVTADELPRVAERLAAMRNVRVEGLMTHLASADGDDTEFSREQMRRFAEAVEVARRAGLRPRLLHAAASAGALRMDDTRLDLVRVGIAMYGSAPFPNTAPGLLPAMRLRTEVISLRSVPAGATVGYSGAYRVGRPSVIATIPIGYADGFVRRLSSEAEVLVHGARCRVVGNVSMDLSTVDVTDLSRSRGVSIGDEVVVLGPQRGSAGFDCIRAEEIAQRVGTIPYEVLTAVSRRVPRVYVNDDGGDARGG